MRRTAMINGTGTKVYNPAPVKWCGYLEELCDGRVAVHENGETMVFQTMAEAERYADNCIALSLRVSA